MRSLRERPDQFVLVAFYAGWLFGMIGILGGGAAGHRSLSGFLAIGGALIAAAGLVASLDLGGALDRLSSRFGGSWHFRLLGRERFTRFWAALLLVIGLGWTVMGLAEALAK